MAKLKWPRLCTSNSKDKSVLKPLAKGILHQKRYLCESCTACVRSCGTSIPDWLHSGSYLSALDGIENEEKRPKQSHKKYKNFAIAVRAGCFICNALLEEFLAQQGTTSKIRLHRRFRRIRFDFFYIEKGEFACRLTFALSLRNRENCLALGFTIQSYEGGRTQPNL